jgi:hypothetical protein
LPPPFCFDLIVTDTPLAKLYRARLRAQRQIAKLEPQLEGYRSKLADIEAKIIKLDGLLFLPPKRWANPYFKPGELPRIALRLMREANAPVSVRWLAGRALALKGCHYPGPGVMKATRRRLSSMLTAWGKRGIVVKSGTWRESRHRLVVR